MKAVVVTALSDDLSGTGLAEVPEPCPAPGEILVEVRAAALNHPDLLMTRGAYQLKPPLPFVPGMEVAGTVLSADPGSGFAAGDEVVCATRLGGLAERVACPEGAVRPLPRGLDPVRAAAAGTAYLTAYVALVRLAAVRPGEWVLVHGASGGVGLAAVDLAKALGARVIATSRSAAKLRAIAERYAVDATCRATGFREEVKDLTGGGADIVFDPVGGDTFDESARCIAFGGRLLVVGFTSGRIAEVATNIPLIKGFSVIGVRAGEYVRRFPDRGREDRETVWSMIAAGRVAPHVDRAYPLSEWREAFAAMGRGDMVGKLVIEP